MLFNSNETPFVYLDEKNCAGDSVSGVAVITSLIRSICTPDIIALHQKINYFHRAAAKLFKYEIKATNMPILKFPDMT